MKVSQIRDNSTQSLQTTFICVLGTGSMDLRQQRGAGLVKTRQTDRPPSRGILEWQFGNEYWSAKWFISLEDTRQKSKNGDGVKKAKISIFNVFNVQVTPTAEDFRKTTKFLKYDRARIYSMLHRWQVS